MSKQLKSEHAIGESSYGKMSLGTEAQADDYSQHDTENLEEDETPETSRFTIQPGLTVRGYLRHVRLQLLPLLAGCLPVWKSEKEDRKVAMYHCRSTAAIYSLLHLVPLCAALTLLVLQWTNFVTSFTNDDTTTLQFVAKLHELFMQVSLAEIVVSLIRTESVNGFIPLGMLSGIDRATQISYLWSLDFWSTLRSSVLRGWRHFSLIILVFVLVLLTSLVGPCSAILMIPRPASPYIYKSASMYAREAVEKMYPSSVGPSTEFNLSITSAYTMNDIAFDEYYESAAEGTSATRYASLLIEEPFEYPSTAPLRSVRCASCFYTRAMRLSTRSAPHAQNIETEESRSNPHKMQTNITIPTLYSTTTLREVLDIMLSNNGTQNSHNPGDPRNRDEASPNMLASQNGTVMVEIPHPVVVTECVTESVPLLPESVISYLEHDQMLHTSTVSNYSTLAALAEAASASTVSLRENRYHAPIWGPSPSPGSSSLVGVFIMTTSTRRNDSSSLSNILNSTDQSIRDGQANVVTCTIGAFWEMGQILLQQTLTNEIAITMNYAKSKSSNARDIVLDIAGINSVHDAQFNKQLRQIDATWADPLNGMTSLGQITNTLGAMFALSISEIPRLDTLPHFPGPWNTYDIYGLAWHPPTDIDPVNITKIKFTLTSYGYGYGTRSTSIYLAMAVILSYCIITCMYITYTIVTGSASTAWNSGIELVTLALQSRKPDHLGHLSVGIDSIKTFSERVGIRVNRDDELELVFANDRELETRRLRKIERNKAY